MAEKRKDTYHLRVARKTQNHCITKLATMPKEALNIFAQYGSKVPRSSV